MTVVTAAPGRPLWHAVFPIAMVAIFALAVAARLVPVLHGGGLGGLGNYDDGVHFAAAIGFVHGLLPYRDFLLLHPPGIVVLLSPFAMLASVLGDATAMKLARLAWMTLGGANAVLTGVVLRPLGRAAAILGALGYALFFPAIYSEHTVLLEAPATSALLGSLALLRPFKPNASVPIQIVLLAGVVAGVSPAMKIWGVVPVLLVAGWLAIARGWRPAWRYLVGAVLSCATICLPFFLAAPAPMWRMVVRDQLERRPAPWNLLQRVDQMAGLSIYGAGHRIVVAAVVVVIVGVAAVVVCSLRRGLRLPVVLVSGMTTLLMSTPSWFLHYSAAIAAPAALLLGSAAAVALDWLRGRGGQRAVIMATAAACVALLVVSYPLTNARLGGARFPGRTLAAALADQPGCITTDWPTVLIQADALSRNVQRGCRFQIDLGGWSYDLGSRALRTSPRARNPVWQQFVLDYFRSGNAALVVRFQRDPGLSAKSTRTYRRWPELCRVGRYVVRAPQP